MHQLDLRLACQRQRERRSTFTPPREYADASRLVVEQIANETTAKRFVTTHHYASTFPPAIASFGMFETHRLRPAELVGVATFSVPMNVSASLRRLLEPGEDVCELGRFVLTDRIGYNAETRLLSLARSALGRSKTRWCETTRSQRPKHPIIVSFSDPVPRSDAAGRVSFLGHTGAIYQGNIDGGAGTGMGLYVGRGSPKMMWLCPDGSALVDRTLNKLRNGECGARHVYETLRAYGAPPIARGETGRDYVARALSSGPFRPQRHRGNHKYLFLAGSHQRRRTLAAALGDGLPYPRRTDPA